MERRRGPSRSRIVQGPSIGPASIASSSASCIAQEVLIGLRQYPVLRSQRRYLPQRRPELPSVPSYPGTARTWSSAHAKASVPLRRGRNRWAARGANRPGPGKEPRSYFGRGGFSAQLRGFPEPSWQGTFWSAGHCFKHVFGSSIMDKTLLALAVAAALGLGSLCTTGSAAATPVRSLDALPLAAASADLADQVVLVCRTRRVCGPMGHCRREQYCERQPERWGGPGSGTGTGGGGARGY